MSITDATAGQFEQDRELGYNMCLNDMSVAWLASEVRMLHVQRARAERERWKAQDQAARREANQRHIVAHEIAARMFAWKLGKHATAGAMRALDAVYPISRCPDDCPERQR